jgi:nickel-dependent lactate racemase
MARIELPYGRGTISIDVPDQNLAATLEGTAAPEVSLETAFASAWTHPIGTDDPATIVRRGEKLVFVVTDHTRPTPTARLLPLIWERLRARVRPEDVTVLVATGTHRRPSEEELERMFGDLRRQFRFAFHDCDQDLVLVGKSRRGTPIWIDRVVAEADRVVTIGHIGMHYYAGYSGGRKNILPGVCGRETIEQNHAQLTDPHCEGCVYEGNPISEEMVEAARLAGVDFIVDVVLDAKGRVARVVVGDLEEAHAAGRSFWDSLFKVTVREKADVVIVSAGGHPKDIDLYQAYKALYNAGKAVRDGGIVLLVAACPDGIGDPVFTDWVMRCKEPNDVFQILRQEGFRLGGHKAVYLAKDLARSEVYLASEIDDGLVRRFFLKPARDAKRVLALARERFGDDFRVVVMPHGGGTVPVVEEREPARAVARL